jgi:alpha-L-fucosidase 2
VRAWSRYALTASRIDSVPPDVIVPQPSEPAWKSGSVTGLRARGGFEVDLAWRDGKFAKAVLRAPQGGKARVRAMGKIETLTLAPGDTHTIP